MTSKASETDMVAVRYAGALLELASETGVIEAIDQDLKDLAAMIGESGDFSDLLQNPLYSVGQKRDAVTAIGHKAGLDDLTIRFLSVLANNRRLDKLAGIIGAFESQRRTQRGEVEAHVETTYALDKKDADALQKQLSQSLGSDVALNVTVNKDLLGGMIVTVGSRMIDDSVKRKLERLEQAMRQGSNLTQLKEVG